MCVQRAAKMTLYEWLEQERLEWKYAQPIVQELQGEYLAIIEDLLTVIKALDFPIESLIIKEYDEN